jgi:NADP-dependent 3-hydroxy acid dehydrogenase YdfG
VLNGRSEAKLEAAVTQLVADDIKSSFGAFDVFDPQTVKGSIVKIEAKVGTIGILVTNSVSGTESCREIFPSKEARADANQSR